MRVADIATEANVKRRHAKRILARLAAGGLVTCDAGRYGLYYGPAEESQ